MNLASSVYWAETPWSGRLAVSPRPRGDDWLEDEISAWRKAGVDVVVSLLTPDEIDEFGLLREETLVEAGRMRYVALPIPDRDVPPSTREALRVSRWLAAEMERGRNVLIHCRQGVGRSDLIAATVLAVGGVAPDEGFPRLTAARGVEVPETERSAAGLNASRGTRARHRPRNRPPSRPSLYTTAPRGRRKNRTGKEPLCRPPTCVRCGAVHRATRRSAEPETTLLEW